MSISELSDRIELGEGDPGYRPIRALPVIAFVLSLSAVLVFFTPVLVVLPAAAAVMGAVAYLKSDSSSEFSGNRRWALAAVIISLGVSSIAITNVALRQTLMYRTAQQHAETWLDHIYRGDFRRAHQFAQRIEGRVNGPGEEHLNRFYDPDFVLMRDPEQALVIKPSEMLRDFRLNEPQFSISRAGEAARWNFVGPDYGRYRSELDYEEFALIYEFTPNPHQADKPLTVKIIMERKRYGGEVGVQWHVRVVLPVDGGPPPSVRQIRA